jgi:hypothetical protein
VGGEGNSTWDGVWKNATVGSARVFTQDATVGHAEVGSAGYYEEGFEGWDARVEDAEVGCARVVEIDAEVGSEGCDTSCAVVVAWWVEAVA